MRLLDLGQRFGPFKERKPRMVSAKGQKADAGMIVGSDSTRWRVQPVDATH